MSNRWYERGRGSEIGLSYVAEIVSKKYQEETGILIPRHRLERLVQLVFITVRTLVDAGKVVHFYEIVKFRKNFIPARKYKMSFAPLNEEKIKPHYNMTATFMRKFRWLEVPDGDPNQSQL